MAEPCPRLAETGSCVFGEACRYSHGNSTASKTSEPPSGGRNGARNDSRNKPPASRYTPPAVRNPPPASRYTPPAARNTPPSVSSNTQEATRDLRASSRTTVANPRDLRSLPENVPPLTNNLKPGAHCSPKSATLPLRNVAASSVSNQGVTYQKWRYFIPIGTSTPRPLTKQEQKLFCGQALTIAQSEPDAMQRIIRDIAADSGLIRVKELFERPFEQLSDAALVEVFGAQMSPFLQLLTLKSVERSILLEEPLTDIYTFLFGRSGRRAVPFADAIARFTLITCSKDAVSQQEETITASIAVFLKIVQCNDTAKFTETFVPAVESLSATLEAQSTSKLFQRATRLLRTLKEIFKIGLSIPDAAAVPDNAKALKPTYDTVRDLPGELSNDGPRHDNDHDDIRRIKIMPTLSEILSDRGEYIPTYNPNDWHCSGPEGLIDRSYRHVREDTVGQLRDVTKAELQRLQNPIMEEDPSKARKKQRAYMHVYEGVKFVDYGFDARRGVEFAVAFNEPQRLWTASKSAKERWWNDTRRLANDALVCVLDAAGAATFMMVSVPNTLMLGAGQRPKTHNLHKTYPRIGGPSWDDRPKAHAVLKFVEHDDHTAEQMIGFFDTLKRQSLLSLVEFPGVLVPAFKPTLEALKLMRSSLNVPFSDLLASATGHGLKEATRPPAYSTATGFRFDVRAVLPPDRPASLRHDESIDIDMVFEGSSLDGAQRRAFVHCLTHALALVQGPPGTGKSYTGVKLVQTLLDNKSSADMGPIVCCTMTNHALDQLLETLIRAGVKQIVRIGSRSKSDMMSDLNLRKVTQRMEKTRTEKQETWKIRSEMQTEGDEMMNVLREVDELGHGDDPVARYLESTSPQQHAQLFSLVDEEGFETVDRQGQRVSRWVRGFLFPVIPDENHTRHRDREELQDADLRTMTLVERAVLCDWWTNDIRSRLHDRLKRSIMTHEKLIEQADRIRTELELRALETANVVGITTSGLARNLPLLRKLNAKVLLVEEAGEVQEAHLLTAFLPSLEHIILIGDHQQLRPQVQNYFLTSESSEGKRYCLDVSLFERLVSPLVTTCPPLPFCTLETQRRMHPDIAQLIRVPLYPNLEDAHCVKQYPGVCGMRHSLFWLDHSIDEDAKGETKSHCNTYEAEMTVALVTHLVRQGAYKPSDIAVLTPYLGQVCILRDQLNKCFEVTLAEGDAKELGLATNGDNDSDDMHSDSDAEADTSKVGASQSRFKQSTTHGTLLQALRLSTVDNFQGEEAKVVVISLVRCNKERRCGFLRTSNRINVLLSRAKHGMYIVGNAKTYEDVPLWAAVLKMLKEGGRFGESLALSCPRHPYKSLEITEPDDFSKVAPQGGCDEICGLMLDCGHCDISKCHSDLQHSLVVCQKSCMRSIPGCSTHECPNTCGVPCPTRCEVKIKGIEMELKCGHTRTSLPCYQYENPALIRCNVRVEKSVPGCGHKVMLACSEQVTDCGFFCSAECNAILDECGHSCSRRCFECNTRADGAITKTEHGKCFEPCGKSYRTCRHTDTDLCHGREPCTPCTAKCDSSCAHSTCEHACHEGCTPCTAQDCATGLDCTHTKKCTMPCSAPCDWVPCSLRCEKTLECGCRCPTVCGEPCPSTEFCQIHGSDSIKSRVFDDEIFEELDLDDNPCVVLQCGHVFTIDDLDAKFSMDKYYKLDSDGYPLALKTVSQEDIERTVVLCPDCRGSLRGVGRYGRIVRRALLDRSVHKLTAWSNHRYVPLAKLLLKHWDHLTDTADGLTLTTRTLHLTGSRDDQIVHIRERQGIGRYGALFNARQQIMGYLTNARNAEAPLARLRDAVDEVCRQKDATSNDIIAYYDVGQDVQRTKASLLGIALLLRCDIVIISDVLDLLTQPSPKVSAVELKVDFKANRTDCEELILLAEKSHHLVEQVEGHQFWARYAIMESFCSSTAENVQTKPSLIDEAIFHLDVADALCSLYPNQTRGLAPETDSMNKMLKEVLYFGMWSNAETKAIVAAMSTEHGVFGDWSVCDHGHLFSNIGHSKVQASTCPDCGAEEAGQLA